MNGKDRLTVHDLDQDDRAILDAAARALDGALRVNAPPLTRADVGLLHQALGIVEELLDAQHERAGEVAQSLLAWADLQPSGPNADTPRIRPRKGDTGKN